MGCGRRLIPGRRKALRFHRTLANIYLHYSFDLWAARWRHRQARGNVIYVRYADDLVAGFEQEEDAKRFLADLRARLEKLAPWEESCENLPERGLTAIDANGSRSRG